MIESVLLLVGSCCLLASTVESLLHLVPESIENAPINRPGYGPADTPAKLQKLGILTQSIPPTILEDAQLKVPALMRKYGYGVEVHTLQTSDGYLLEMHRVISSPHCNCPHSGLHSTPCRPPVFLQHGLLDSSGTWAIMGTRCGLAYLLADLGYDVWMGNSRGNRYSRRHVRWNPDGRRHSRRKFWAFSWHETGVIDVPEMLDFVLAKTGCEQLHYVGHSQGTTAFFVMAAERPEYNAKVLAMHALAPVAYMSHLRSPMLRAAAVFTGPLDLAFRALGQFEFLPHDEIVETATIAFCHDGSSVQALCANILFLYAGSSDQLNRTMIPVIAGHSPAGTSTLNVVHYGQLLRSGAFRQFDHGRLGNWVKYGSFSPPAYNLSKVCAPVCMYYSTEDWMAAVVDVEQLGRELPNVRDMYLVPHDKFNHLDFTWGMEVKRLVYDRLFENMRLAESGRYSGTKTESSCS